MIFKSVITKVEEKYFDMKVEEFFKKKPKNPTRVENLIENRFSSFQKHSKGLLLPYLKVPKKYMKLHLVVEIEHRKNPSKIKHAKNWIRNGSKKCDFLKTL